MHIVTFCDIDDKYLQGHQICYYMSGCSEKGDIAILDINSIFDFEEKKIELLKNKFISIAIIDDPSDFDAFKNFGITAWIKREGIDDFPKLLQDVEKRLK